jgi:hypothetical protein
MGSMEDEEVVLLLREVRDLQRLHFESYKDAVRNQQLAIELQRKAGRLYRRVLIVAALLVLAAIGYVISLR